MDIRCCLDWLQSQGYEQFGILGTSLGSCYAFLAAAHDERLEVCAINHVFWGRSLNRAKYPPYPRRLRTSGFYPAIAQCPLGSHLTGSLNASLQTDSRKTQP